MTSKIAKYITTKPTVIQIAKDEVWERTWNIDPTKDLTQKEIENYLNQKAYKSIAVESIFKELSGYYVFGITFRSGLRIVKDDEFINSFYQINKNYQDFTAFINRINIEIIGRPSLFIGDPDKIRIGVVNYWFSVGPCSVWEKGQPKQMTTKELDSKLLQNPKVMTTELNYQGISFVYNLNNDTTEPTHWMKSPCSDFNGKTWSVNKQMVTKYLEDWQQVEVI